MAMGRQPYSARDAESLLRSLILIGAHHEAGIAPHPNPRGHSRAILKSANAVTVLLDTRFR